VERAQKRSRNKLAISEEIASKQLISQVNSTLGALVYLFSQNIRFVTDDETENIYNNNAQICRDKFHITKV